MRVAITLPEAPVRHADRLARRMGKSRSELVSAAVAEYVARHEPEAMTAALNRLDALVDTRPEPFSSTAASRLLERSEW